MERRADIYKSKDGKWTAYQYAKELGHKEIEKITLIDFEEAIFLQMTVIVA